MRGTYIIIKKYQMTVAHALLRYHWKKGVSVNCI